MADLDPLEQTVRRGLRESTARVSVDAPADVGTRLDDRRTRRRRRRATGRIAVASIAAIAVLVTIVAWPRAEESTYVEVGPGPASSLLSLVEFGTVVGTVAPLDMETLPSGWHDIDPGPVPVMHPYSTAWVDGDLLVAGWAGLFVLDLDTGRWAELEGLPFTPGSTIEFVIAGDHLVGVLPGDPAPRSVSLDRRTGEWRALGEHPLAPEPGILGAGPLSGGALTGAVNAWDEVVLVWTDEAVLDLSHRAVLDLAAGTWRELGVPEDPAPVSAMGFSAATWTGTQARTITWSTDDAIAWNADGTEWELVPGLPVDIHDSDVVGAVRLAVTDGVTAVVGNSGTERGQNAAVLDHRTGQWSALPRVPANMDWEGCPGRVAWAGEVLIAERCVGVGPVALLEGTWQPVEGTPPTAHDGGWTGWMGTPHGLVTWAADTDEIHNPRAPYTGGSVWIPPRASTEAADP